MRALIMVAVGCGSTFTPGSEFTINEIDEVDSDVDTQIEDNEDTGEPPDTDEQIYPTGLIGGVVQVRQLHVPCAECFGLSQTEETYAGVQFHPPTEIEWTSKLPDVGTCASSIGADPVFGSIDVGPVVHLSGPSTVTLPRILEDGEHKYRKTMFSASDIVIDESYSVLSKDGDTIVENAVTIPSGFDWISPSLILADYQSGAAYSQPIRRNLTNEFTWVPAGNDLFVIGVEVYNPTGEVYKGGTVCVGIDNGQFLMPIGPLQGFDFNDVAAVYMYRWDRTPSMDLTTGHTIEGIAILGVLGTAVLID